MAGDVEYKVTLDDSQILDRLQNIDKQMRLLRTASLQHFQQMEHIGEKTFQQLAKQGKKAADDTGKSFKKMGVIIGAVSGIVQQLTNQFLFMAKQIPRAFGAIIGETIEANKLFEKFSTQFTTLLGSSEAAQERVKELIEFNIRTPFELSEIVEASRVLEVFGGAALATGDNLTMVGDIAAGVNRQFEEVALWIGRAYDALQNGRPWGRAALALQQMGALSGDARAEIERMQQAGEQGEHVWQRFVDLVGGRFQGNMERLANTMVGVTSNLEDFRVELLRLSGEKFFDAIRFDLIRLFELLEENREPLVKLGVAFGDMATALYDIAISGVLDQLESLDPAVVEDLAEAMDRFADAIERATHKRVQGDINGLLQGLTSVVDIITALQNILNTIRDPLGGVRDTLREFGIVGNAVANTLENLQGLFNALTRPVGFVTTKVEDATKAWRNFNVELEKFAGFSLVDLTEDIAEATEPPGRKVAPRRGRGAAPTVIPPTVPTPEQQEDIEKEYAKFLDRLNKLDLERGRRLIDINLDYQRKLLDDEIEAAQKREDLARRNAQRIEDIYRKYQEGLADAALDLSRAEEDIARKAARDRIEVERDSAREQLDIETEYRRELQRIRDRFNDSAAEAERRNDAQAYLAAVRQRDREIRDAKLGRQERLEDASKRASEQREELRRQLEYEIEDARIANRRKLEDLQYRLERELEAQRLNYQREEEEQTISEQRKRDERLRAYTQELEDFRRKETQRLDDLQRALDAEYKKIDANERRIAEMRIRRAKEVVAAINAIYNQIPSLGAPTQNPYYSVPGVQEGGPVDAGRPYIVGERGPELFIPAMSGTVLPNSAINLPAAVGATTVSNVSTTVAPTFNVAEDLFNNPVAVRKLQNLIMGVLVESI